MHPSWIKVLLSFKKKRNNLACRCCKILGVTVCTEQDQSHINLCTRPKKNQKSDSFEREKAKTCQLPPKAGYIWYFELNYCVVAQEENAAVLRSVSFRLGTECLELSIFCTLKHRRVQKRVHYFCRGYAPSTTSASLFLPWPRSFCPLNASLPLVSLPLVSVAALWSVQ